MWSKLLILLFLDNATALFFFIKKKIIMCTYWFHFWIWKTVFVLNEKHIHFMLYTILSFNNPRESKYIIFSLKKFIIRNAAHNVLKLLCAFIKKPIKFNHNLLYRLIWIISNQNYFKLNTNEDIIVMISCNICIFSKFKKLILI